MSASSKKKLRKEQNAAALTEKQQKQQKDKKSLKMYTLTFVVSMVLIVALGLGIVLYNPVNRTLDKRTTALTVAGTELNTTMLNYFLGDAIDNVRTEYKNAYGDYDFIYAGMEGLDFYASLEDQNHPEQTEKTWAQVFIDKAIADASNVYSLYNAAVNAGHKLTEDEETSILSNINTMTAYAIYYAYYDGLDSYLQDHYGPTANQETYTEYLRVKTMAQSYSEAYFDGLKYTDADYREFEKKDYYHYSSYNFSAYDIVVNSYRKGGTTDENGNKTYSDAEIEAAQNAAKADAESLGQGEYKDSTEFDKAIAALEINKDKKDVASTLYAKQFGGASIAQEDIRKWLSDEARTTGDIGVFPQTTKDSDGKEVTTGYTVIMFHSSTNNTMKLVNVRHILLKVETTTDKDGNTVPKAESLAQAESKAKELLDKFNNGKIQNGETFGALAKEHSDDGSAKENGLIEEIYPGMTVEEFDNWCFDANRKVGDTEIIKTEFGVHVMYFEGFCDMTYRDKLIDSELRDEATTAWIDEIVKNTEVIVGKTSRLHTDRTMA
ncbi:MAG: peptidylprolyl isomerase [Oscillospiraceae bacterium]|nr:peptidylprolyl isomerase [Oscillospiraceae bacterium]